MVQFENVAQLASLTLQQADEYLLSMDPNKYQARPIEMSGSSIGEHTRHFIEFFLCLKDQVSVGSGIDYDQRPRNRRLEEDPLEAIANIRQIQRWLANLSDLDQELLLIGRYHSESKSIRTRSSLGRELVYNIDHTIHHLAIIKMACKLLEPTMTFSNHFGVAAATLLNQKTSTSSHAMAKFR